MSVEEENTKGRVKSVFGTVFGTAKGYVEEKSRQVKDAQEVSTLLSQVSMQKNEIAFNNSQLFFSEDFGKNTNLSQKEQFIYRRCQQFRQMVPLEQSARDDLIRKADVAGALRENSPAYAQSLKKLIDEIKSYNEELTGNQLRISLSNNNVNSFNDLRAAFDMLLKSQILVPQDAKHMILLKSKDTRLRSIFISNVEPMMIKLDYTYVLYPDFILVLKNNGCILDILSPSELKISITNVQRTGIFDIKGHYYVFTSKIGSDSRIIKEGPEIKHYAHERKDGRPDTRYKDNEVISRTREDLAENGVLHLSIFKDETDIEFSSYKAASSLNRAAQLYCIRTNSSSISVLRLLDLLSEVSDSDNTEINELSNRYTNYIDNNNSSCRIVKSKGM